MCHTGILKWLFCSLIRLVLSFSFWYLCVYIDTPLLCVHLIFQLFANDTEQASQSAFQLQDESLATRFSSGKETAEWCSACKPCSWLLLFMTLNLSVFSLTDPCNCQILWSCQQLCPKISVACCSLASAIGRKLFFVTTRLEIRGSFLPWCAGRRDSSRVGSRVLALLEWWEELSAWRLSMCGCSWVSKAKCVSVSRRCILPSGWTTVTLFFSLPTYRGNSTAHKIELIFVFRFNHIMCEVMRNNEIQIFSFLAAEIFLV